MTIDGDDPLEEQVDSWMIAYDEALETGASPPALGDGLTEVSVQPRLQGIQSCLEFLERVWPRAHKGVDSRGRDGLLLGADRGESGQLQTVGRFTLLKELGRGGCGIVFLAFDPLLQRQVALKVPRLEALVNPDLRKRFLHEAQAAAVLDHPHVVPVYETGEEGAVCYIASAYCEGPTLAAWLKERPWPIAPRLAAQLMAALADAVQHAHDRGVLHRDLKPGNIMMQQRQVADTGNGNLSAGELDFIPRVTDFGMAKVLEEKVDHTKSGVLVGTPAYMAPEQADNRRGALGPATDVHALGIILYELLTGRTPFLGASLADIFDQVRSQEPVPPRRLQPHVPRDLETICLKCLQKDPRKRYPTAADLGKDLRRFLAGEPILARPIRPWNRMAAWCRRPQRISNAGAFMIVYGLVFLLWCAGSLISVFVGTLQVADPRTHIAYLLSWMILGYLPMIWIGWKVMARGRYALWLGALLAMLNFLYVAPAIVAPDFFSGVLSESGADTVSVSYDKNAFLTNTLLVLALAGAQVLAFVIAVIAFYANRKTRFF